MQIITKIGGNSVGNISGRVRVPHIGPRPRSTGNVKTIGVNGLRTK